MAVRTLAEGDLMEAWHDDNWFAATEVRTGQHVHVLETEHDGKARQYVHAYSMDQRRRKPDTGDNPLTSVVDTTWRGHHWETGNPRAVAVALARLTGPRAA